MANVADVRREMTKTKEQLEEEKKISLSIRIRPLELDGMDVDSLKEKGKELWDQIVKLETEKYDLEEKVKRQEDELKKLKEKQAKRKEIRAEQEKKLAQQKKEEEERLRKEEAEKKAQEAEEKRKKMEEAEKKRQEMMKAQKEKMGPAGGSAKKNKDSGMGNVADVRREMTKTKEQLEEEKKISLSIRIKP